MNPNQIMKRMNDIEYGFPDEQGNNILKENPEKYEEEFDKFYYLQTPDELLQSKCGVCWEQVELERKLFQDSNIPFRTYFIYIVDGDRLPSHTFLTYEEGGKYYWFEHSWGKYQGIHEYRSEVELLLEVRQIFEREHSYVSKKKLLFIYEYQKPKEHITCDEFYQYIETQRLVKIQKPLYFYHLVNKNADMRKGLLSLQYMYNHKMYDLFDKNVEKYKKRITTDWNLSKYKNKKELTREEYLDGLSLFRGKYGGSYLYFFRYPPYKELGKRMENILKEKDIYRINLHDEEVMKHIKDIFYGYDFSHSDYLPLDKKYYEEISKDSYFQNYQDEEEMNYKNLNHIGIAFQDDFCPLPFLTKCNKEDVKE